MRHTLFACALVALFTTANGVASRAEDWAEFRGPQGQGHSTAKNLPTEWDGEKNVAWKQAIPGLGWSSPVLVADRLYLTTAVKDDEKEKSLSLRALCVSAKDGKILWSTELFHPGPDDTPNIHKKNSHASPSPLIYGDQMFVHFGHQGTACLDLNGQIVWKANELKYAPVHGNGCTPILADNAIVFSCDGKDNPFVAALDIASGKLRWKTQRDNGKVPKNFAFATPQLINVNGRPQVVSPGANSVNAYDPTTGREIWKVNHPGYSVIPRPVFGHGLVFISTSYDSPQVMAIRPDGEGDVTDTHVVWTMKKGAPHTPSMLLIEDELYMVSDKGVATCVDAKTGKEIWQQRIGGNYSASPLYADGRIYLQSEEGIGTVIRPGKEFEKLFENDLGERTLASYAVCDGAFFIRSADHLFRIQTAAK